MPLSEFDLIQTYFTNIGAERSDVLLGVGDDCALLQVPRERDLAVSIDTLVSGRHFGSEVDPEALGHKALAVNLSDLAAIGADPAWATLALTLPRVDNRWLRLFAKGFSLLAARTGITLVGGDTTRGPLSITVQVHGFVSKEKAMPRNGARPGDLIYVSGQLGDAALALLQRQKGVTTPDQMIADRLDRPEPRLELSRAIRGIAGAAVDVSDGLLSDVGHICESSDVSAEIEVAQLPVSAAVKSYVKRSRDWRIPLAGGDDYELCFTVSPDRVDELHQAVESLPVSIQKIGVIGSGSGVKCNMPGGVLLADNYKGYDHFAGTKQ